MEYQEHTEGYRENMTWAQRLTYFELCMVDGWMDLGAAGWVQGVFRLFQTPFRPAFGLGYQALKMEVCRKWKI